VELTGIEPGPESGESSQKEADPSSVEDAPSDETARGSEGFAGGSPGLTGTGTIPTDAELERGILDAVRLGLGDVARTLSVQLTERQRGRSTTVVAFPVRREQP
jgi:hypothetical protein